MEENDDNSVRLFSSFTSGSTGEPKEVMHSSESAMGIISQLTLFPFHEKGKDTWLHTITPPSHVSAVIASACYPLADGQKLILDSYCKLEDLDIEMMHYKPSGWALVPIFFDILSESDRIPPDYDMGHFKLFGFGAVPMTKKYIGKVKAFLDGHRCRAPLSQGYGQSEGGSAFTTTYGIEMMLSGSVGFPLIDTTIAIFEPDTAKELKYNEIGEICKSGPGLMLGYPDKKMTEEVLKVHPDGKVWLHTGDFGYMTEEGLLHVLGREKIEVYPDKAVFPLEIENRIASLDGVKEAIVVSGKDRENHGFEAPYLFVVPENGVLEEEVLSEINCFIDKEFSPEQKPKDIFVIDKKPVSRLKVDKRALQRKYGL